MASLPTLPTNWIYNEKLPFGESNTVEFKEVARFPGLFKHESPPASGLPKYRDTVIGFLNSGNGYLIMGILDNGTIKGVAEMSDELMDRLNLWVDTVYRNLVYKDGSQMDPAKTTLRAMRFSVEGSTEQAYVVVIEAIHKGEILDIATRGGEIVYRLNASNYKMSSEPVYRKNDIQGMVCAIQTRMQEIIREKHRAIENLQEKHADEMAAALKREREHNETELRNIVSEVSSSLYSMYRTQQVKQKQTTYSRIIQFLTCNLLRP